MGTNYYRINIPTEDEREYLHEELDDCIDGKIQGYEFRDELEATLGKFHICKISCGWKVLFDHNWGTLYKPCKKELNEFLNTPNTIIEDEYGERFTPKEFWDIVEEHNSSRENKWTYKSYRLSHKDSYDCYSSERRERCIEIFNIDPGYESDFFVDGLRFATFSDFS